MGVSDIQVFLESGSLEGGIVSVDLLKIARNVTLRQQPHNANRKIRPIGNKLKLIIDAENCLDRLYGGYFSDWACGGQWNRMLQFLSLLTRALERGNIELAVVFNGTIEVCRMEEWIAEQANIRERVNSVLKHTTTKGTPPPKVWWAPPISLRSALRMALRHLGVSVMCTMDDHHQEVIAYCREYGFHGLLADDAEYAAFDPPRYFSSQHLKLTYKGSIETKEFMVGELTKLLKITQEQVCVMAALLGNFLLPEIDLQDLYKRLNMKSGKEHNAEENVKILAEYVKQLPPPANIEALVVAVLGSSDDNRASTLRQSVQYYLNGTASGFLKYCAPTVHPKSKKNNNNLGGIRNQAVTQNDNNNPGNGHKADDLDMDHSGFASETTEQEQESLQNYKVVTANTVLTNDLQELESGTFNKIFQGEEPASSSDSNCFNGLTNGVGAMNNHVSLLVNSDSATTQSSPVHAVKTQSNTANLVTPTVSPDVLRTASLRHQKGLMAPMILHVLSMQEVRLPCLMEDENHKEFPSIHKIYLPLRKRVYAVLFNLHHLRYVYSRKKDAGELGEGTLPPDVVVKEWVYSRANPYSRPENVKAEPLPWAVPTLQRLWFGPSLDDKRRRMRALLTCLNSDTPLILNTGYVPQHLLIMACVLRYIMSQDRPIMRRHELDAFLCHAFNPNLMNPQYLQGLTLNVVTSRGVQLAALFMEGVNMALLANDACGAPLPWLMCCPWLYFDGKLFHDTLTRSAHAKSTLELCNNILELVVKVERMRKAILEGLDVKFANVPMPRLMEQTESLRVVPLSTGRGSGGVRQRPMQSRGGQLQIAGVVVGSWGANYGYQQNMRQQQHYQQSLMGALQGAGTLQPAGAPLGGFQPNLGRGRGGNFGQFRGGRGGVHMQQQQFQQRKAGGPPTFPVNRKNTGNKKRNTNKANKNQQKGLALTVKTDNGDMPVTEVVQNDEVSSVTVATSKPGGGKNQEDCNRTEVGQGDGPVCTSATTTNHSEVLAQPTSN